MPQIIARVPQQGTTRDSWDTAITTQLEILWFRRMPRADLKIASAQKPLWLAGMSPKALGVLEEIIVTELAGDYARLRAGYPPQLATVVTWDAALALVFGRAHSRPAACIPLSPQLT